MRLRKFAGGSYGQIEGKKGLHLIKWQTMCKSKTEGGLGLGSKHNMNRAFITKLAWRLIHDKDSLWTRVLRGKYVKEQDRMTELQAKNRDSPLRICKAMPNVVERTGWSLGNVKNINFWGGLGLDGSGPFRSQATSDISAQDIHANVADMFTGWDRFTHLLPVNISMIMFGA